MHLASRVQLKQPSNLSTTHVHGAKRRRPDKASTSSQGRCLVKKQPIKQKRGKHGLGEPGNKREEAVLLQQAIRASLIETPAYHAGHEPASHEPAREETATGASTPGVPRSSDSSAHLCGAGPAAPPRAAARKSQSQPLCGNSRWPPAAAAVLARAAKLLQTHNCDQKKSTAASCG
jgi:hypothetical protein